MSERQRKRRFSTFLSEVRFDGEVLRIEGRRNVASVLLLVFAGLLIGFAVMGEDLPPLVRGLMGIVAPFPLYGFVDVFFGESSLEWWVRTGDMRLVRGSPFGRVEFEGSATPDMIEVGRMRAGTKTHSAAPMYQVVLTVELDDALVKFPLEATARYEASCEEGIAQWREQLGL